MGILLSQAHYNWLTGFGGRHETDLRYSASLYNSFPWLSPAEMSVYGKDISEAVQGILDARKETGKPLSEICKKMPASLQKAHKRLDRIVDEAYGLPVRYENRLSILLNRATKPVNTLNAFY